MKTKKKSALQLEYEEALKLLSATNSSDPWYQYRLTNVERLQKLVSEEGKKTSLSKKIVELGINVIGTVGLFAFQNRDVLKRLIR